MAIAPELLERYRPSAVKWNDLLLLPADAALALVDDCEREAIRLLGYDAFEPGQGDTMRCRPEDGLDASGRDYWDYSIEELCDVIRDSIRARASLLFAFLLL